MRTATALLALGAVAQAQQFPFVDQVVDQAKGWFSAASSAVNSFGAVASSSVSSAAGSIPTDIPNPVNAAASAIAAGQVKSLSASNYKEVLVPGAATASPSVEDWMVYVTGGNKTCMGWCGRSDAAWNKSVATLSAIPGSPHLAQLNCETDGPLCNAWAASPPSIIYMRIPQPLADQSQALTEVRFININRTSITAPTIVALYSEDAFKQVPIYEGFWHPFNGPLAETGANIAIGYILWGISKVPSWLFMVSISMFSRTYMSKRMQPGGRGAGAATGAPVPPPARR